MKLLNRIIDKLQETFPPNRIMLGLAAPIVAASAWLSGLVASNIPGIELPVGVVSGVIGAAVLIAITLIYKWFDQWQRQEPIDYQADLEAAIDDLDPALQNFLQNLGSVEQIGAIVAELRARVEAGSLQPPEIASNLGNVGDSIAQFLHDVDQARGVDAVLQARA